MIVTCQQQHIALGSPVPDYTSVRHQMPQRRFMPVVASALPFAILSDPSLATRTSMQGSLFARPDENVKRAPQNDARAVATVAGVRRTARHITLHRINDVNAMDRAINSITNKFDAIASESSQYGFVNI